MEQSKVYTHLKESEYVKSSKCYLNDRYNRVKKLNGWTESLFGTGEMLGNRLSEKAAPIMNQAMSHLGSMLTTTKLDTIVKSVDEYTLEKVKMIEELLPRVYDASKMRVHFARLIAEDLLFGVAVGSACNKTSAAIDSFENFLKKYNLIKNDNQPFDTQFNAPYMWGSEEDMIRRELLMSKQFDCKSKMFKYFANPELLAETAQECRIIGEKISILNKRIGASSTIQQIPVELLSLFYSFLQKGRMLSLHIVSYIKTNTISDTEAFKRFFPTLREYALHLLEILRVIGHSLSSNFKILTSNANIEIHNTWNKLNVTENIETIKSAILDQFELEKFVDFLDRNLADAVPKISDFTFKSTIWLEYIVSQLLRPFGHYSFFDTSASTESSHEKCE